MPGGAQAPAPKGQVVQIVSLPDALKDNARALRIEGEVVAQNKDGSIRIKTDQGNIDVQMRGRQPQVGTKIEVDIPAGHPPRQATVRTAPAAVPTAPMPQTPAPVTNIPVPQTPVADQPDVVVRPTPQPSTPVQGQQPAPVDGELPPVTARPAPLPQTPAAPSAPVQQLPPLPPLSAGQIVQLTPLPQTMEVAQNQPTASQTPIIDDPATLPLMNQTATQANLAAQKTQGGLISTMLQAVKSVLPNAPSVAIQPASLATPPNAVEPLPLQTAPTVQMVAPSVKAPIVLHAQILSITSPSGQTMFTPQSQQATPQSISIMATQTTTEGMPPAIAPAVSKTAVIPAMPQASSFTVSVIDHTPQNQPIIPIVINTESGETQNFIIKAPPATLPAGSQITLMPQLSSPPSTPVTITAPQTHNTQIPVPMNAVQIPTAPVSTLPPAWRSLAPLMQPLSIWPAIDDVFQSFYQATPQAAQILGRVIPSPANPQNFGPAVLLFAAALKSGDIQGWLGEKKLEMIQKLGKEAALSRLSGETSTLNQSTDAAPTEWKSYPIPLLYQNEISKVLFHVRREPDEQASDVDNGATHFVMDVSLTRMGEVQLDGLVRGNRVDLTVRTELPLTLSMQDAMRTAYAKALDNTTIYGDIGFQSDVKNFIVVLGHENALASA